MPPMSKQNYISGFKNATFEIGTLCVIEIKANLTTFHKKHFLRPGDGAFHRVVIMRLDNVPYGTFHVSQLL